MVVQPYAIGREQRMAWERLMADLALQLGDHETATRHALRVLYRVCSHVMPKRLPSCMLTAMCRKFDSPQGLPYASMLLRFEV